MSLLQCFSLLIAAACLVGIQGFSDGPPPAACGTLSPNPLFHGAQPQETELPFQVLDLSELDEDLDGEFSYTPGETYRSKLAHCEN